PVISKFRGIVVNPPTFRNRFRHTVCRSCSLPMIVNCAVVLPLTARDTVLSREYTKKEIIKFLYLKLRCPWRAALTKFGEILRSQTFLSEHTIPPCIT
ncbi:hypothetical protein ACFLQW_01300, partial [Candidatus Zixiibacteriota bacterium]